MKTTVTLIVVFLIGLSAPAEAWAQEPAPKDRPGVDLSIRTGFALPFGRADADAAHPLNDELAGGIPIVLEGAARITPMISAGVLFQFVPLLFKDTAEDNCGNGVSCSGAVYHLGVELLFHFPQKGFAPWMGLGTGYEWLSLTASQAGVSAAAGANGFEFLMLQAGIDFRLDPQFTLGGFAMLSFSQYGSESVAYAGNDVSSDVTNTAIHEWLVFGVRGTIGL